ncbi:MAG: FkbM family methyltransferase [Thermoplasmataceae archaeon]
MVLASLLEQVKTLNRYRKAFSNFFKVTFSRISGNFPVEAILKSSKQTVIISDKKNAYYVSWYENVGWSFNIDENKVIVKTPLTSKELVFYGAISEGDLIGCFFGKVYDQLEVKGKTVLDVGGSIGDSAVLFSLMGSERVILIEPYPKSATLAKINVEKNGFENKVVVLNAGIGNRGEIRIPLTAMGGEISRNFGEGESIPIYSIKEVADIFDIRGGILKMDCEGCEYDAINEETDLSIFDHIQLEYHHGVQNIPAILEKKGFNIQVKKHSKEIGDIIAKRV